MAGFDPNEDDLIVSDGADFVATYIERKSTWPAGTVATMSFPGRGDLGPYVASNVSTEKGDGAYFKIPRTDTSQNMMPRGTKYLIHLEKNGVRFLWFRGKVSRQD